MKLITLPDYADLPRIAEHWLIDELLPPRGLTWFVGESKVGKSTLVLQMAMALASGTSFLLKSVTQTPVMYCQFDTSQFDWSEMLNTMRRGGVTLPKQVHMLDPNTDNNVSDIHPYEFTITTPSHFANLLSLINQCQPGLVVLDTLSKIHNLPENQNDDMKRVCDLIMPLTMDRSVLIIHHSVKDKEKAQFVIGSSCGSQEFDRNFSSGMLLKRKDDLSAYLLVKPRTKPEYRIILKRDIITGLWSL